MLTKLTITNFKRFQQVEIELGQHVVFIGPNNSGKTTALQALALWYEGVKRWKSRSHENEDVSFLSFAINRLDLVYIPVPDAELLLTDLGQKNNRNLPILIKVNGISQHQEWTADFSYVYSNAESVVVRFKGTEDQHEFMRNFVPNIVFLPPMSGLSAIEPRIERGRINVLIGEGRTAEVLRNLCYLIYEDNAKTGYWDRLVAAIRAMFRVDLLPPEYLPARGEIRMAYRESSGILLDLSSSGRGMLQILLLLTYMYINPGAVLLLDEPDAHLEIIRQREIYHLLTTVAREQGSQIIAASHSEVILEEASGLDTAIAFVGKPHRIDRQSRSQVAKALKSINAVDYYLAEQTGWVLYLEGSTDLAILQAFAQRLQHSAAAVLQRPFVHYLGTDTPRKAVDHFQGLREAKPDLIGLVLVDRRKTTSIPGLQMIAWSRREIENYLAVPDALLAYARSNEHEEVMAEIIRDYVPPIALRDLAHAWWRDTKASDDFLDHLFSAYFEKLGLPNLMLKRSYHDLANDVPIEQIDPEVIEKLDAIVAVAQRAQPRTD